MPLRAIVLGATGLVGKELVKLALADDRLARVAPLVRRPSGVEHPKLDEHVVDFRAPERWPSLEGHDVLFSSLGTTLKIAGSKDAQREVDYTFQYRVAETAARAKVGTYVLVSSMGANPSSLSFYSRMKGELDRDVQKLGFLRVRILRPSILVGERETPRFGERVGEAVLGALSWMPGVGRARPIGADVVARAMMAGAFDEAAGTKIVEADAVFAYAGA